MTIVFKSGATMDVTEDVVKQIQASAKCFPTKEWFFWVYDGDKLTNMINVFDISHIKQ